MARSIALNTVVYNEAHRIVGLLAHAAAFCDELVVVDQSSTDGTGRLAAEFADVVVTDEHHGFCEPSRPLAAEYTESDWIVYLDADEVISPHYLRRLLVLPERFTVARLGIATYVDGVRIRPDKDNRHPRFFRKGHVRYGLGLHTRIEPDTDGDVFSTPDGEAWVLNTKQRWEWELDRDRYEGVPA